MMNKSLLFDLVTGQKLQIYCTFVKYFIHERDILILVFKRFKSQDGCNSKED